MSASEASDDYFNKYALGHMPIPDFKALAREPGISPCRRGNVGDPALP